MQVYDLFYQLNQCVMCFIILIKYAFSVFGMFLINSKFIDKYIYQYNTLPHYQYNILPHYQCNILLHLLKITELIISKIY